MKQELKDLKVRYQDGYDQKKKELMLSNIAASQMFTYYKMRESINNRLSNLNLPMSFSADEGRDRLQTNIMNEFRASSANAGRESLGNNRMSLRSSVLQGSVS